MAPEMIGWRLKKDDDAKNAGGLLSVTMSLEEEVPD